MSSFRQYGGLNRSSANNIVRSSYSNSNNQTISNILGLPNSNIVCESNLDLSGNNIYNVSNVLLSNGDVITGGSYSGSLVVGGNLEVKQNTNLDGSVDIGGDLTVDGNLEVKQNTNLDVDLYVGGNLSVDGLISTFLNSVEVNGDFTVNDYTLINGDMEIHGFLNVYEDVSLNSTLEVAGQSIFNSDVSLNSTLHVKGKSVFNSDVSLNSMVEVFGQSIFNYDVSMNSTLHVAGQTSSASFLSGSDYRIKSNVEPLDDNYTVDELIPVKYVNIILEKEDFGFIAHEVQNVFPNLVTGEKDGDDIQTLNYIGLIAILTKEIQELKRRVAVLEKNHQL